MKRTRCFGIVALLLILMITPVVRAQPCDPVIQAQSIDNWALKYRERANRCEGFYNFKAGSALEIVGLTQGQFQYTLDAAEVLEITSPIVVDQPVHVRAVGIPSKTYYRLDAVLEPGGTFAWPVGEVLNVNKLPARDVGVFGWIGAERIERYVPLAAAATLVPAANDGQIRLTLRPAIDVKNVQWRSAERVNDACATMSPWTKLATSAYRKGEPIRILLPTGAAEVLCVEVTAQSQQTAAWEKNLSTIMVGGH